MWSDGAAAICVMSKLTIRANTACSFIVVSEMICLHRNCHISASFLMKLTSQPRREVDGEDAFLGTR